MHGECRDTVIVRDWEPRMELAKEARKKRPGSRGQSQERGWCHGIEVKKVFTLGEKAQELCVSCFQKKNQSKTRINPIFHRSSSKSHSQGWDEVEAVSWRGSDLGWGLE